jgi:pimeloyl-ACP methyl ester carboxylesterase
MTDAYFDAFRAGEPAAIETMIDFYGGAGTFAAWPERVRRYAIDTTAVNILDWACAYDFQLTPPCLANIDVPALVLRGGASHPAMRCANGLLAKSMANASVVTVAGAAHFMISTHAREVAREIGGHLARLEGGKASSHLAVQSLAK